MSRVLVPVAAKWYDELKAVAYYGETDFELSIRDHLNTLFPDHFVFPFKKYVTSRITGESKKPDLAMVRRDFKGWGIIEVELSDHSINHVLGQTQVFLSGEYNAPDMAAYVKRKLKDFCGKTASLSRLTNLLASELPSVLVIADAHAEGWNNDLKKAGVDLCIFEIYKSARGQHLYRTFGDYPKIRTQEAHCRRHKSLPNVYEIIGDFQFRNLGSNNEVSVSIDGNLTRWGIFEDGGKSYLRFLGKVNMLSPTATYALIGDKTNRYYFERS